MSPLSEPSTMPAEIKPTVEPNIPHAYGADEEKSSPISDESGSIAAGEISDDSS